MSDAKYFHTTKKGEIKELQEDLNSVNKDKIKEAVKKIIAAMTVGKDVSMLFTDVIKSMGTDNIELKKLIYLYIINYARSQPEKAILVVSMFCKDATNHPNPLVRALALRTMGCIRINRISEYLCDPLAHCLKDRDPYVRKTAAIAVAKFYDTDSDLVKDRGFIHSLRDLLSDPNPMVVANAVASLTEICEASGIDYFKINNKTLSKLLTALNECAEWGRVFILEALSKFEAKGHQARDICDRVIPQLRHSNSAVVMAAVKVIIKFMERISNKQDEEKYCKELGPPLITLLSSPPEIQYVSLRNIDLIIQKYPQIFCNDIRIFYVKYNDEVYVKNQKLEILVKLTTKKNVNMVLKEFEQYAQEIDIDFVKRAVRGIGRIAIKLELAAEQCVATLSNLIKTKVNYIVQEAVIVVKDIFRRYPRKYEKIIVTLCDNLETLNEPKAKASMIWIIGEYAERIIDAKDRLEHYIESFQDENENVQLQLLTATVKLFLKKPDKAKGLVQKVLNLATESSNNPDLRDRGYVYWRLLSTDPSAARKVVLAQRPIISSETYSLSKDYLASLLQNLSSLSSVYHCKPNEFVGNQQNVSFIPIDDDYDSESSVEDDPSSSDPEHSEDSEDIKDIKDIKEVKDVTNTKDSEPVRASINDEHKPSNVISKNIMDELLPIWPSVVNESALRMVFDSNKSDGLEMSIGFERKNNKSIMTAKCVNKGNDIITRIDIKFNKNYLGIQPKQTLPLNGSIKSGETQIVDVILESMSNYQIIKYPLDLTVQMAARAIRQNKPPKVTMFAAKIPAQIFFDNKHDSNINDKHLFLSQWKRIPISQQEMEIFDKCKNKNVANIKEIFENNSFQFIIQRNIPNRGISLYFSTTLKNVVILLEVSIANTGKCRIVTKSQNKYLSNIICNAMKILLMNKQ